MSTHAYPIGLQTRRTWWPSASTCAFLASGLEMVSFVFYLWQRTVVQSLVQRNASGSAAGTASLDLNYIAVVFPALILLIGLAVEATALWGVGRRQRHVAPVSARLGQWAIVAYVVSLPLFMVIMSITTGLGVWPAAVNKGAFQVATSPMTLALACLGWASRGGTSRLQQWASGGLIAVATFGVFSATWRLLGLPTGEGWLWVGWSGVALRVAMWAAVGAWLRSTTIVSRASSDAGCA